MLRFIRFAFRPVGWGWNLIGPGIAGIAALLVWADRHPFLALFLGAVGFVMLFLVGGVRLQGQLDAVTQTRPKLTFTWWGTSDSMMQKREHYWDADTGQLLGHAWKRLPEQEIQTLMLRVKNDPPGRNPTAVASDAIIELALYDPTTKEGAGVVVHGRWTDNPQIIHRDIGQPTADLDRRTLLPNGEEHRFDVAAYYKANGTMYVSTNEFYKSELESASVSRLKLEGEHWLVQVTIRAVGLPEDKVGWFRLHRLAQPDDDGNLMTLEHIPNEAVAEVIAHVQS